MKDLGTRTKLVAVLFSLLTLLGCGALEAGTPASKSATGLPVASTVVDFGDVEVGNTAVRTNIIVNNTSSPVVFTRAQIDKTDFTLTGQKLPLTVAPGQRAVLQLSYSPKNSGNSQSRIVLASNVIRLSTAFTLRGTSTLRGTAALGGRLKVVPSIISFGNVVMGQTQVQSATLSNTGKTSVTVTRAAVSGKGFTVTGVTLPLVLAGGQSVTLGVRFTPVAGGAASGAISIAGRVSTTGPRRPITFGGRGGDFAPVAIKTISTTATLPLSGTGMGAGQLAISPSSIVLGRVKIGSTQTQQATLINTGTANLTVRQVTATGRGFRTSGLSLPLVLAAGQRKNFMVAFTAQASGSASGSIAVTSDAAAPVVTAPVTAVATAPGALISNPSSLSFGSVQVGQRETLSAALTNSGGSSVTVSQANVSGAGYTIGGLSLPVTLGAGQSAAFSVTVNPQAGSSGSGAVSFTSDSGTLTVPLAASLISAGSLVSAPGSLNFGSVPVGTPKTISGTLTNSGGSSVNISQANLSGTGFTLTGLNLPATLAAGQSASFTVTFTPQSGGAATGSLAIASNATNPTLNIPLSANVAIAGVLSTSDSSLTFGSVAIGGSSTQSETLTNSGGTAVTISQAKVSGTGFSATGLTLPLTLNPGQSFTFGTVFAPTTGGSATGSVVVTSDASNSTLTITLAGTATVSGQLAVSPATLSFGSVMVGQSKSLTASLTASGSSITVSNASMSTSEFTVSGISLPLTLKAGQSASFTVNFAPQSSGTASASGSFISNASNSSLVQALSGTGTAAPQHSVALSWTASASNVVGYNVYRSSDSGASFSKITSMNGDTTFTDSSVQSGRTYVYVTTAVDGSGKESANSNQTQAVIPTP